MNRRPKKAKVGEMPQVLVRIEPHRMEKLRRMAAQNERSIAAQARLIMKQGIDREEASA